MPRTPPVVGNTLLEAPALDGDAAEGVYEVLSQTPSRETNLLVISYRDGPDRWLADWHHHVGQMPADLGFIHVGETTRSTATTSGAPTASSSFGFVDAVRNPSDLTGLGIQISNYLERWADSNHTIIVYFDSLTSLLQFADLDKGYRFLHVLSGRIKSVDGHAFYRIDPNAHQSQTVATLQSLMDDTIDVSSSQSE